MRVLVSVGSMASGEFGVLASLAVRHELILARPQGSVGPAVEVALRNELPDRDLITVLAGVVVVGVDGDWRPHGIVPLRSIRALVDSGALVVCALGCDAPLAIDGIGVMKPIDGVVDAEQSVALLARRLNADLLLVLTDDGGAGGTKAAAARSFVAATGRRAAIGPSAEMAGLVSGSAGSQIVH